MATAPVIIRPKPGVQRDGTRFDAEACIDAQWTRWRRGLPRKMGGYRNTDDTLSGLVRGMHMFNKGGIAYVHAGSAGTIDQAQLNSSGTLIGYNNRTPAGFATNAANQWQFDVLYDAVVGNQAQIVAHPTPSVGNLDSSTETSIYIGNANGASQLTAISTITASGGILALAPYLTAFGTDGRFSWSALNDPSNFTTGDSGEAFIAKQKIVRGLPMRGGVGSSPSGLYWALNALVRVYYVGGAAVFGFDTQSENTTILSAASPVEYDGVYFWPGIEHFHMYNGTVRELPNTYSLDYFFDNINPSHTDKVFSFRNKKFGEIWWCYPHQDNTECTHAVIYNVRENHWYDTQLPGLGRSSAISPQVFKYPLMSGVEETVDNTYKLWQHEIGTDEVDGASQTAIRAYFETNDLCLVSNPQSPVDKRLHIDFIEPDFTQTGDITVTVTGNANARADEVESESFTIVESPAGPSEQLVTFKETRRQLRMKFESNVVGGHFEMGKLIAHIAPADGTRTG